MGEEVKTESMLTFAQLLCIQAQILADREVLKGARSQMKSLQV